MKMAALQFFVGQPRIFAAEHQRHLTALLRLSNAGSARLARIQQGPGNAPIPRTGTQHHAAPYQRLLERSDHPYRIENIGCARSPGNGLGTGKFNGIDQNQPRQPHVLHCSGGTADVARMTGIDQHHANVLKRHLFFSA